MLFNAVDGQDDNFEEADMSEQCNSDLEVAINMDSVFVTASDRHKNEPFSKQKCKGGEDMISNLPDFIIGHILSFLSTKDAVRTSVLSKRWIYMWTLITELRFEDRERSSSKKIRKACFLKFVYRVLLHLNSTSIQSFSLDLLEVYDPSHINQWISIISNRRVKKICVYSWKQCNFSSYSLFKCLSLEELVLEMLLCVIRVPIFVCLSSLTVLKLSGVTFTCYSSNDSKELTLNFPVLRKYETKDCIWSGVKSVNLEVPLLEVVSIDYSSYRSLSDGLLTEIKFCSSRLTEFSYSSLLLSETILLATHIASNIPLVIAKDHQSEQENGILVSKLLNDKAECLKLELYPELYEPGEDFFADIPTFGMLSCLELDSVTGEILLDLLSKSPCLKTLVLENLLDFDEEQLNSAIVPDCFLSTLKVVKFERLDGYENELRFAKFVMENAQVLERISFSRCHTLRSSTWETFKEKLFSFKRSFSSAIMEFLSD